MVFCLLPNGVAVAICDSITLKICRGALRFTHLLQLSGVWKLNRSWRLKKLSVRRSDSELVTLLWPIRHCLTRLGLATRWGKYGCQMLAGHGRNIVGSLESIASGIWSGGTLPTHSIGISLASADSMAWNLTCFIVAFPLALILPYNFIPLTAISWLSIRRPCLYWPMFSLHRFSQSALTWSQANTLKGTVMSSAQFIPFTFCPILSLFLPLSCKGPSVRMATICPGCVGAHYH